MTRNSRRSEEDLYDLLWLFDRDRELYVPALIELGTETCGGMNGEALPAHLVGTE